MVRPPIAGSRRPCAGARVAASFPGGPAGTRARGLPPCAGVLPALLALLIGILLLGEAGVCAAAVADGAPDRAEPVRVRVQLQWRHQWQFAGFYAALEQGFYREAGLDVELKELVPGMDLVEEVLQDRADFATAGSGLFVERLRRRPIRLLASWFQRSPLVLVTRPEVVSPRDLKGLRIQAEPNELLSANLRYMLTRFGLSPSDVEWVGQSFSTEPFVRGEVDATLAYLGNEPFLLRKRGIPFGVLDPNVLGVELYDLNLFTSADYAARHRQRVRAFVAATERGWRYALEHPDAVADLILARWNTQGKTREHLLYEAHYIHAAMLPEVYPLGSIDPARLARIQSICVAAELAEARLPPEEIVFDFKPADGAELADSPALTADEEVYRYAHPVLSVAYFPVPPYALERDGEATGYTVDLMQRAARRLGMELRMQRTTVAGALEAVRSGEADLTLNVVHTPSRDADLIYGGRTLRVERRLYARADRKDLAGGAGALATAGFAVWPGKPGAEEPRQRLPGARLVETRDSADALEAVRDGRADLVVMERRLARTVMAERGIDDVADLGPFPSPQEAWATGSYFAVARGNPTLAGLLDKALAAIGPGELERLHERWLGRADAPAPSALPERAPDAHARPHASGFGEDDAALAELRARVRSTDAERAEIAARPDLVLGTDRDRAPPVTVDADGRLSGIEPAAAFGLPNLTPSERAYLERQGGRLTYCLNPYWAPYDYLENGEHRGIFKDYLELFARKLGVTLVPLPSRDWSETLRFAEERRCDLVAGAVRIAERERYLSFTSPYVSLTHVLVARADAPFVAGIESLPGKPVGVPTHSAIATQLKARYPDQPFVTFTSPADGLRLLSDGDVYAAVIALENAAELLDEGLGRLRIIGKLDEPYPISVAVRNDAPELLAIMQKAVDATTPAERDRIAERRTTFRIEQRLDPTRLLQILAVLGLIGAILGHRQWELGRLNRRLRLAAEAALVADRAKGEFLANMSHEIRTPLNAVLNLAALGARGGEPERQRARMTEIERAGRSLLAVVNEILDFSRLEGRAEPAGREPFDLAEIFARVTSIVGPLAGEKGLQLHTGMDPGLAGRWLGDAHKIERVLINLLGNAVKFTERGEVRLAVSETGADAAGCPRLAFEVSDTGIGFDPAQIPELFAPFRQGDSSLARRHGGTGLGLAIVKRLVELMGGSVEAEGAVGQGARFRVLLPLERLSAGGQAPQPAPAPAPAPQPAPASALGAAEAVADARAPAVPLPGAHPRVLVVEDNALNRRIVCELLAELGVAADTVPNGETALARLKRDPAAFDLVLMDVQMPGLDGWETTRRLRADPRLAGLPVVAITAHILPEDLKRCAEAGMNGHIAKPFEAHSFARTLARWLPPTARAGAGVRTGAATAAGAAREEAGGSGAASPRSEEPWVDIAALLAVSGQDRAWLRGLAQDFVDGFAPHLAALDAGAGRDGPELEAVRRAAHALRGTAPMVGASRVGALAGDLEARILAEGQADPHLVAALRAGLAATLKEMGALAAGAEPHAASGAGPRPDVGPGAQARGGSGPHPRAGAPAVAGRFAGAGATGADPAPEGGHILVVEDDPMAARLLAELVGGEHRVSIAPDGERGLALARARPAPDLILLDVVMEGMDGYDLCARLKSDPATRDIPVIFVTAHGQPEQERRGLELGAVDYIRKPFRREVVLARVRTHLTLKRQGDALARLSEQDPLTGLANRRGLDAYLAAAWTQAVERDEPLAILLIDVDRFKGFNDRCGHAAGDDCLRRVAAALREISAGAGLVGRWGGDELLWILPGGEAAAARAQGERAARAVRALAIVCPEDPHAPAITLSIGVASCRPRLGGRPADCLAEADRWLYRAKSEGRDRVRP